jgi:hypothetical protein
MDKKVNQVPVYLQKCIGEFHDVTTCHFCWEYSQEKSLGSVLITRNETRGFYLSGLGEDSKNPLCRFLLKYQVDNVEKCFYQYFTRCGRGTNENALLRVLKVISTYGQDSELDKVLNLFQFVYDQIRMNSSGNNVKNGAKKRKTVEKSTEVSFAKKSKTESVISVSDPMNQDSHPIQNTDMSYHLASAVSINQFVPMFLFDLYDQLAMAYYPYYSLPIHQESVSESISAALSNAPAMPGSLIEEKKPNLSTVVENNDIFGLGFEQLFLHFEDISYSDGTLDSNMLHPAPTESEDINQDGHSSTLEFNSFDFIFSNYKNSSKVADLLILNELVICYTNFG